MIAKSAEQRFQIAVHSYLKLPEHEVRCRVQPYLEEAALRLVYPLDVHNTEFIPETPDAVFEYWVDKYMPNGPVAPALTSMKEAQAASISRPPPAASAPLAKIEISALNFTLLKPVKKPEVLDISSGKFNLGFEK
jgi:hypothetical protein